MEEVFSLEEVKKLIINAYEVGFCDGKDSFNYNGEDFKDYRNANDFWEKNKDNWVAKEINY